MAAWCKSVKFSLARCPSLQAGHTMPCRCRCCCPTASLLFLMDYRRAISHSKWIFIWLRHAFLDLANFFRLRQMFVNRCKLWEGPGKPRSEDTAPRRGQPFGCCVHSSPSVFTPAIRTTPLYTSTFIFYSLPSIAVPTTNQQTTTTNLTFIRQRGLGQSSDLKSAEPSLHHF